jgi:hypothetical protein
MEAVEAIEMTDRRSVQANGKSTNAFPTLYVRACERRKERLEKRCCVFDVITRDIQPVVNRRSDRWVPKGGVFQRL